MNEGILNIQRDLIDDSFFIFKNESKVLDEKNQVNQSTISEYIVV